MVKSKFIAFVTAFSMIASLGTGFITAQADGEAAVVNSGIELVYDAEASNETTKVINAYYKGAEVIASAAMAFHVDGVAVTDVTYTTEWGGSKQFNKSDIANGNFGFSYTDTEASEPTTDKIAMTLTLTVAEDVDFKVTMTNVDLMTNEFAEIKYSNGSADQSWVNVPAFNQPEVTPSPIPTAEVNNGIDLVYDADASNETTKVIKAYYKGADVIASAALAFHVDGVTVTAIEYTTEWGGSKQFNKSDIANGNFGFSYTDTDASEPTTDKIALVLTLTVAENAEFKVTATNVDLMTNEFAEIKYSNGSADEAWVIVPAFKTDEPTDAPTTAPTDAPTDTPTDAPTDTPSDAPTDAPTTVPTDAPTDAPTTAPTDAPTDAPTTAPTDAPTDTPSGAPIDVPTATPETITRPTEAPEESHGDATPIPQAEVNAGIDLVYDADASNETTKVIKAYYKGADVIASAALAFHVDGVTVTDVEYTTEWGGSKQFNKTDIANGNFGFSYTDTEASEPTTDKIALVLTLTVAEDVEFKVTATNVDLMTNEFAEIKYSNGSADEAWVIVPAYADGGETPAPVEFDEDTEIPMSDTITAGYPTTDLIGFVVKANKSNAAAEYGKDFVAEYPEGTELTENEFNNLVNGFTSNSPVDIASGLKFKTKYGVTFGTAPMYQTSEQQSDGNVTVLWGYVNPVPAAPAVPTPTPTATAPAPTATATTSPAPTRSPSGGGGGGGGSNSRSGATIANSNVVGGGTTVQSGTVVATTSFNDLGSVPWAETAINVLAGNGVVNGTAPNTFEPLGPVTRAQFTKMVCIAFGVGEATPATPRFTDVAPSDWFYSYVEGAAASGIVKGVSDTEFDPNALVTREQMATMMYRAMTVAGVSVKTGAPAAFTDAASISGYAVEAVNALSSAGVINGMDDGRFAPQETANRAQAACIIYQYFLALAKN